jgi:hypothetical protein
MVDASLVERTLISAKLGINRRFRRAQKYHRRCDSHHQDAVMGRRIAVKAFNQCC